MSDTEEIKLLFHSYNFIIECLSKEHSEFYKKEIVKQGGVIRTQFRVYDNLVVLVDTKDAKIGRSLLERIQKAKDRVTAIVTIDWVKDSMQKEEKQSLKEYEWKDTTSTSGDGHQEFLQFGTSGNSETSTNQQTNSLNVSIHQLSHQITDVQQMITFLSNNNNSNINSNSTDPKDKMIQVNQFTNFYFLTIVTYIASNLPFHSL